MREGTSVGESHSPKKRIRFGFRHADAPFSKRVAQMAKRHLIAILALWGALWGIATFYYKDVLQPSTAPVNISLNLELKKVSPTNPPNGSPGSKLIAVEMQLGATNPSSREVYLLPNAWIAYGYRTTEPGDAPSFAQRLNDGFASQRIRPQERFGLTTNGDAVAGGVLLSDTQLKPGEKVMRKLVFHVPRNRYDVVEVWTAIPTTSQEGKLRITWRLVGNELLPDVRYNDKERRPLPRDAQGNFIDAELELQQSSTRVALSLWE